MDFRIIFVDCEKKKKMLVGYHHPQFVRVVDVFVDFLDHPMVYHDLELYNIQPRRRRRRRTKRRSKLHTGKV